MMVTIVSASATIVVAVIGGLVAWRGHKVQQSNAQTDSWAKQLQEAREQFDVVTERMEHEIARLDDDVKELRAEIRSERARFRVAVEYIRVLRRWIRIELDSTPPDVPSELADDI